MKVLFLSNLFPDATEQNRGSYNAQLLKRLSKLCEIRVLSPRATRGVPPLWLPKARECRPQEKIFSPVYPPSAYIPKIGSRLNHLLMARSIEPALRKIREKFAFDVVLSSWIYPDACATAELARRNNFPFVAIAQGSDVHQYLKIPARRKIIEVSLSRASAIVARSCELGRQLVEAGIAESKIHTIYNGVDLDVFRVADKGAARRELKLPQEALIFLFVGNLLPIKNPLLLIEAHAEFCRRHVDKNVSLVMIGMGPLRNAIRDRAEVLGTGEFVFLLGGKPSSEVARYMQAADLLCVPSDNEGVPNVILEAFASGLRVIAREVGGIPEVLSEEFLGNLVGQANPSTMANAMNKVISHIATPEQIRFHATKFSWENTAQKYFKILQSAIQKRI